MSAKVRFSSRVRINGRLGQQRDVVLLDDAEPHAVALSCPSFKAIPPSPAHMVSLSC
ncbi:MAG TPA: hypothetical protein VK488_13025 [Gaiellaceae bacterium]|nr:hypothetical protein [Gaiellaceae bacterium]